MTDYDLNTLLFTLLFVIGSAVIVLMPLQSMNACPDTHVTVWPGTTCEPFDDVENNVVNILETTEDGGTL